MSLKKMFKSTKPCSALLWCVFINIKISKIELKIYIINSNQLQLVYCSLSILEGCKWHKLLWKDYNIIKIALKFLTISLNNLPLILFNMFSWPFELVTITHNGLGC